MNNGDSRILCFYCFSFDLLLISVENFVRSACILVPIVLLGGVCEQLVST